MEHKLLKFKLPAFEPIYDTKGRRIPYFLRSRATGMIYFRREFRKLRIPPIFEKTDETTLGRAKTRAEMLVQRHKNRYLGISDDHVFGAARLERTVGTVIDEVLQSHTPTCRRTTRAKHAIYLKAIRAHLGARDIKTVTHSDLESMIAAVKRKSDRETFGDYAKHMNLLMRFAYQRKYVTHLLRFKAVDRKARTGRVYTDDEIAALWSNMDERLRDQFVLSYECMMRLREVLYLPWSSVDLRSGQITLEASQVKTGSKTGRGRSFFLSDRALQRLRRRHLEATTRLIRSPFVFPARMNRDAPQDSNRSAWRAAKKLAGIKGRATWHDLRHTAITKALIAKRDIFDLAQYCGNSVQIIERTYAHVLAKHTRAISETIRIPEEE